jgi:hypothetical protein
MPVSNVLYRGKAYSHTSCQIYILGLKVIAITKLNWKTKVERGKLEGTARQALTYTDGTVSWEASMTIGEAAFDELVSHASVYAGIPFMDAETTVSVYRSERNMPSITDDIHVVGWSEVDESSEKGTDPHMVDLTADVLWIKRNGLFITENTVDQ